MSITENAGFQSKTGIYKCATCLEVCAEPGAFEAAKIQRNKLLTALEDLLEACPTGFGDDRRLNAAMLNAEAAIKGAKS